MKRQCHACRALSGGGQPFTTPRAVVVPGVRAAGVAVAASAALAGSAVRSTVVAGVCAPSFGFAFRPGLPRGCTRDRNADSLWHCNGAGWESPSSQSAHLRSRYILQCASLNRARHAKVQPADKALADFSLACHVADGSSRRWPGDKAKPGPRSHVTLPVEAAVDGCTPWSAASPTGPCFISDVVSSSKRHHCCVSSFFTCATARSPARQGMARFPVMTLQLLFGCTCSSCQCVQLLATWARRAFNRCAVRA